MKPVRVAVPRDARLYAVRGDAVRLARTRARATQESLARALGVTKQRVSSLERREVTEMDDAQFARLVRALASVGARVEPS